jgi:hypothetical protein
MTLSVRDDDDDDDVNPDRAAKEKNPHFVEQVSALYPKDQHLIVVTATTFARILMIGPITHGTRSAGGQSIQLVPS